MYTNQLFALLEKVPGNTGLPFMDVFAKSYQLFFHHILTHQPLSFTGGYLSELYSKYWRVFSQQKKKWSAITFHNHRKVIRVKAIILSMHGSDISSRTSERNYSAALKPFPVSHLTIHTAILNGAPPNQHASPYNVSSVQKTYYQSDITHCYRCPSKTSSLLQQHSV